MARRKEKESYIFRSKKGLIFKRIVFFSLVVALIPAGYFLAKSVREGTLFPKKSESSGNSSSISRSSTPTSSEGSKEDSESKGTNGAVGESDSHLSFYLPFNKIKNSQELESTLEKAKSAGLNAVIFDLKDSEGNLLYASGTEMVKSTAGVVLKDALSIDELKGVISTIKAAGIIPIPRLYAFKDHKASWELHSAKITLDTDAAVTWLDNSLSAGGKAWLNPYATDAHKYIYDMAAEISSFGVATIMLDGIQFPEQTSRANYGKGELVNLSQNDVLKKFVGVVKEKVSADCEIIVAFPGKAVIDGKTTPFGGDPVAIGGSYIAPSVFLSELDGAVKIGDKTVESPRQNIDEAMRTIVSYFGLRVDVMDKPVPILMPWVEVSGYSKEEVSMQIKAIKETRNNKFSIIFYDKNGNYDFNKIVLE